LQNGLDEAGFYCPKLATRYCFHKKLVHDNKVFFLKFQTLMDERPSCFSQPVKGLDAYPYNAKRRCGLAKTTTSKASP